MTAHRYVLRLLGHSGQLIGQRYILTYRAIDKVAAVVIPQAEALRLFGETGGNTVAVLAPMAEALKARGYETLMVLPAQANIVELQLVGQTPETVDWFEDARRLEVQSAKLLAQATATLTHVVAYLTLERNADPEARTIVAQAQQVAALCAAAYVEKG